MIQIQSHSERFKLFTGVFYQSGEGESNLSVRSLLLNCLFFDLTTSCISGSFSSLVPSSWQQRAAGWWTTFSDPVKHSWSEDNTELIFQAGQERLGSSLLLVDANSTVVGLTEEPQPRPQANVTLQNGVSEKEGQKLCPW